MDLLLRALQVGVVFRSIFLDCFNLLCATWISTEARACELTHAILFIRSRPFMSSIHVSVKKLSSKIHPLHPIRICVSSLPLYFHRPSSYQAQDSRKSYQTHQTYPTKASHRFKPSKASRHPRDHEAVADSRQRPIARSLCG